MADGLDAGAVIAGLSALDGELDAGAAPREAVTAALGSIHRMRGWLDALEVRLAGRLQQLSSYPEKVLADTARTSLRDAERTVKRVETTRVLPQFVNALADGHVSGNHIDIAGRALGQLAAGQRDALVARADRLVDIARRSTPDEFRRQIADEVRKIQTDDGMERLERQRRATRLRTWVDHRDGMWCLAGRFDPATGAKLHARLETVLGERSADQVPDGCPTDPGEKQDFLRAQALVALLEGQVRGTGRAEVVVVVDTTPPIGPVVDWGIPVEVPWPVLQDLAATAADVHTVVVRNGVVLHAPGQLNLGRATRVANRAQRRALRGLYATCAIPGCAVRYDNCRLHHVQWWENGGRTDLLELLPVCERHHHCIHDKGWIVSLGPNRELTVTLPDGQVMTTGPPTRRAA